MTDIYVNTIDYIKTDKINHEISKNHQKPIKNKRLKNGNYKKARSPNGFKHQNISTTANSKQLTNDDPKNFIKDCSSSNNFNCSNHNQHPEHELVHELGRHHPRHSTKTSISNDSSSKSSKSKKYTSQILYFPPEQFSHRFGTQFYTIVVPEYRVVVDQQTHSKFAIYKFEVKRGRQTRDIFYRYSEIRQLHDYLCSISNPLSNIAIGCSFPNKTWFKSLDQQFLDKRRKALETYFHHLLGSSRSISQIQCITKFLQLDEFIVKEWWKE